MSETAYLFATAGDGPVECQIALAGILNKLHEEIIFEGYAVDLDINRSKHGVLSALISISGANATKLAAELAGTLQWQSVSPVRPNHKRKNWFVGMFPVSVPTESEVIIDPKDLSFETFRSGGPGGQHQNTTDSGVRVHWRHLTASSRSERSQHQNKSTAIQRLRILIQQTTNAGQSHFSNEKHKLHRSIERGNPSRTYLGKDFMKAS